MLIILELGHFRKKNLTKSKLVGLASLVVCMVKDYLSISIFKKI